MPAQARLPDGFRSPSTANDPELLYEKLIEQRTGKKEALPELVEVPQVCHVTGHLLGMRIM